MEEGILTLTRGNAVPLGLRLRITAGGEDVPVSACEDVVVRLGNALGERYDVEAEIPTGGADVLRLSLPSSLPAGTYGIEVFGRYGEQRFRVAEERVLRIVEDNEGANIWDGTSAELPEMELSLWAAPLPGGQDKKAARPKERLVVVGKSIPAYSETHDASRELYYAFPLRHHWKGGAAAERPCCHVTVSWRGDRALSTFVAGEAGLPELVFDGYFELEPVVQCGVTYATGQPSIRRRATFHSHYEDADSRAFTRAKLRTVTEKAQKTYFEFLPWDSYAYLRNAVSLTWVMSVNDSLSVLSGQWVVARPVYNTGTHWLEAIEVSCLNYSFGRLRAASPQVLWTTWHPQLLRRPTPIAMSRNFEGQKKDAAPLVREMVDSLDRLGRVFLRRRKRTFAFQGDIISWAKGGDFVWSPLRNGSERRCGRYLVRATYRNLVADEGTEFTVFVKRRGVSFFAMLRPSVPAGGLYRK